MTSSSLSLTRSQRLTLVGVVGFAAALALASQVAIPIPGTPVPMSLQPLVVVLAGLWLGPAAGAASMVLYLVAGIAGLPVFALAHFGIAPILGSDGGYLLAYPAAAVVAGVVARGRPGYRRRTLAAAAGIAVIYAGGLAQLTLLTGSLGRAAALGALPFMLMDGVKSLLAGLISPGHADRASA